MNYAADALWWRLRDDHVRALATLLTAPPLWHSGCELPPRALLGETGWRTLLALDAQAAPLYAYLQAQPPHTRLGMYAEHLLAFWLDWAPHTELLARNLRFGQAEADFVARINGDTYHIELACKYFIARRSDEGGMSGFNPQDTLTRKRAVLAHQCTLSQHGALKSWAQTQGLTALRSVSVVRGMAFVPEAFTFHALNPYAWLGGIGLPTDDDGDCRYAVLAPRAYLAPARKRIHECVPRSALSVPHAALVACLRARGDGFWHEVRRVAAGFI